MTTELEVLKEIPGYKAILKSVLKSQIQLLIEQLSNQTGEESIILTASVHDGSLSHLGSSSGKGFLEGRDEIKAQFLGYCLKNHQRRESVEAERQQYNRSRTLMPPARRQRPRIRPTPYSFSSPGSSTAITSSSSFAISTPNAISNLHQSSNMRLPTETVNSADNFLDSVTSDSAEKEFTGADDSSDLKESADQNENYDSSHSSNPEERLVKIEQDQGSGDMGDNSLSANNWEKSYGSSAGQNDGNQENSNFNGSEQNDDDSGTAHNVNFGGIAFPGLDNAHHDFSSRALPEMSAADLKNALYPQGIFKNCADSSNTDDPLLNHINVQGQFDPSPRKRGRPRKHPQIPLGNSPPYTQSSPPPASQTNTENNASTDKQVFRRGRPRKDDPELPPGVVRPMGISIGNGYVRCNVCGKILKATSMFSHKQSHLGIRNYGCEYCGKSFTQKGPLITHKRVHTGEKPYSCMRCGKAFAAHSGLYQHSRRCDRNAALEQFNLTM